MDALPALTDKQRRRVVEVIAEARERGETLGNVAALREIGLLGKRSQLRALIDDDLHADIREARGWRVDLIKKAMFDVAVDPQHKHFIQAAKALLSAYGGTEFRDVARHELTGARGGPLQLVAGNLDLNLLSEEKLEALTEILDAATPKELERGEGNGT